MDIREPVLAIVVGGSVAPGLNGVISAVTLEALSNRLTVVGICDGFSAMKFGDSKVINLSVDKVSHIQDQGGCMLGSSVELPETEQEVDNVLRVLRHRRVRYLVTVGGVNTALCATRVAAAAALQERAISIVHIPKGTHNELPLPFNTTTFGYSTARQQGTEMVGTFHRDARTMKQWWLVTIGGSHAGHLALGIGKAVGATLVVLPEEFMTRPKSVRVTLDDVVERLEGTIFKRLAGGKNYGTIVLAGSLVRVWKPEELKTIFGTNDYREAEEELGATLRTRLQERLMKTRGDVKVRFRHRLIAVALRAAHPNAEDIELTRDLGFGAVRYLLDGGEGDMICRREGEIVRVKLSHCINFDTGKTIIRYVNTSSLQYKVACRYQIRLTTSDLKTTSKVRKMASVANVTPEVFVDRYLASAHRNMSNPKYKPSIAPTFVISDAPEPNNRTLKNRMDSVDAEEYDVLDVENESSTAPLPLKI